MPFGSTIFGYKKTLSNASQVLALLINLDFNERHSPPIDDEGARCNLSLTQSSMFELLDRYKK